ncbi:sulfite exporter TauE/SafE family protein [Oricola thermophila]|uniref:Probable membrane transporter protein n=1 Tax=Oricola thermophila TaxID=2742145 RepID=A0A6N1VAK4_9HYPH|nr:sulfite exporter TauE/SafE family protein [Oricola thermophila]QKV17708.1 sulfite exporter TauE/SafE family protein [Oricola thermophila]
MPNFITAALDGLSFWQYGFAWAAIASATIVQYRTGIGFGLLAAPLLALIAPELVPVPIIMLTLLTAGTAMLSVRGGVDWREVSWSVSGRLLGSLAGAAILVRLTDEGHFMLVFGLLIALAVAMSLAGLRFRFSNRLLLVMGAISGLTATITSVGGPPMAIAYQDQPPERARPNMSAFFAIGCVVILAVLQANGLIRIADIVHAAILTPGLLAGMALAPAFGGLIDRNFRRILLGISGAAAVLLIVRGLA